ncbi:uncharacterized protein LOC117553618 isoform X2 [Gymnodraco acuticeps]|uniref:Uncharacterized protein LOC117553618 isoform X2 n=1 Tax=Gymnodraco acuticeps TaxID=8218 RepID=A0A6P8V9E7_GYMAC|nr:uncharacterized protein LOC117553618 isoform X2 [Gymnodraco acuticeps]
MPRSCSVPFCTTNKLKNPNLKFYILPNGSTEPRRRTRWLQAIRREDEFGHLWDPKSKHVYVCSQHFITECIRSTVPAEVLFQYPRVTAIIDCFEIRIEHSKKLKTRAITYSKYKNWITVKYFIACHPSGSFTYLSKGWGGRASDVHIVRNSDFLSQKFHHAGDQILADRGFTLKDDFAVLGAQLITPSFTRGRKQLSAEDVANSRVTSNIRIHI